MSTPFLGNDFREYQDTTLEKRLRQQDGEFRLRLALFRRALNEAGLHGHYNLFQEHFGEEGADLEAEIPASFYADRPLQERLHLLVAEWRRAQAERDALKQRLSAPIDREEAREFSIQPDDDDCRFWIFWADGIHRLLAARAQEATDGK